MSQAQTPVSHIIGAKFGYNSDFKTVNLAINTFDDEKMLQKAAPY